MRKRPTATSRITFETQPFSVQLWIWRSAQAHANRLLLRLIHAVFARLFRHKSGIE